MSHATVLKKGQEQQDIDISPLIDMVFILLIFFIVTTVFVDENGLNLDTPEVVGPTSDSEALLIQVTQEFEIRHNGIPIGKGKFANLIRQELARGSNAATLEIDSSVPVYLSVELLDIIQGEGIETVTVRTSLE